jgi:demethylmenaquinone methyltransferase / 2-methoxy-6-polyprenyl-1,4-benzoquinol methylase
VAQDPQEQGRIGPFPVVAGFHDQGAGLPYVRGLFNSTAPHYDAMNRLFSLGSGAWYRRRSLLRAGLRPGFRVVDVAVGTGLLAQEAVAITGDRRRVIGVDLSEGMLAIARHKLAIPLVQGAAEALPLADEVADFVTMGYALRHVADLGAALREFGRILRRGGTLLLLEISRPNGRLGRAVASTYIGRVVPLLSRWTTGDAEAERLMRYHWRTIEQCALPETVLAAMAESGFGEVRCTTELDLFRSYVGRKP